MRLYFGERSPISTLRMRSPSGLSDVKPREPAHRDVLLELGDVLRNVLLHREARLAKILLLKQAVLLQKRLDLAVDAFREYLLGLAVSLPLPPFQLPPI